MVPASTSKDPVAGPLELAGETLHLEHWLEKGTSVLGVTELSETSKGEVYNPSDIRVKFIAQSLRSLSAKYMWLLFLNLWYTPISVEVIVNRSEIVHRTAALSGPK